MATTANGTVTGQGQAADEFRNLSLDLIVVEGQVRTGIDTEDESFQGFMASIAEKGVIEPVIVTPRGEKFLLLAGERRFLACRKLGLETIPARILPNVQSGEEILAIQLIENLQRQDIDPIDKANGIVAFFKARHGDGMDLDQMSTVLMQYKLDPARVENEYGPTVGPIVKLAGVSISSMQNLLSLLRLPPEIRDSVKKGEIGVSQGYLFAANLENPGLMTVFEGVLANPVTNKRLTELLKKAAEGGEAQAEEAPAPFNSLYGTIRTAVNSLESGKVRYDVIELENLLLQLKSLIYTVEKAKAGGGTAAEPTPPAAGKKPVLA
ncbi:MAG: ParB/RepB/Spo0J family partition protein [Deltaproteobacteria bacterium]|nr:ParB/RepB/Spo0J family partition protein [Deltaproteobacteria bacterium]